MALLQWSCAVLTSPAAAAAVATSASPRRCQNAAATQLRLATKYSQLRRSSCRASAAGNGSAAKQEDEEEAAHTSLVFKDDSNGVVCYSDEKGDVTCEGWDEGPHFQPDPQQPTLRRRRNFTPSAVQGRSAAEAVNFESVKGRKGPGDSLGEVANESLESSEL